MADKAEFLISSVFDPQGVKEAARAFGGLEKPAEGSALKFAILNNALDIGADLLFKAGQAAWQAGQYMIELGSNAEETAGLIDNSLGTAAAGFRDDIDAIAEATGRSSNALMQGSSSILAMSRSMGFGQEEASKFTSTMSQVAVDLGSFFNQESEQVFIDLQSAMAGSAETMQKYGIDVSVTALQNAALNMGLIEQGETMDRVTRATVLQAEIMRQAADAMGDAERTSDSYTNQSRRLQAVIQDTATELGKELIPALTPVVTALAELATDVAPAAIEGFTEMVKTAEGAILIFGDLSSATQSLLSDFRMFTTGQDEAFIDWGAGLTMALDTVTAGQYSALKNVREGLADYADSVEVAAAAQEQYANYGTDMLALQEMSAEATRAQTEEIVELNNAVIDIEYTGRRYQATWTSEAMGAIGGMIADQAKAADDAQRAFSDWESAMGGYFTQALNATDTAPDLNDMLFEQGQAAGLGAVEMALLASATGDWDDAQIQAALNAALLQEKVVELVEGIKNGELTVGEAQTALQDYNMELQNTTTPMQTIVNQTKELNDELAILSGQQAMGIDLKINGVEALREAANEAERLKFALDGANAVQGTNTSRNGAGARTGSGMSEADFLENMGGG